MDNADLYTPQGKRRFCRTCYEKWGKMLWRGSCICTGDVKGGHYVPSGKAQMKL